MLALKYQTRNKLPRRVLKSYWVSILQYECSTINDNKYYKFIILFYAWPFEIRKFQPLILACNNNNMYSKTVLIHSVKDVYLHSMILPS